MSYLIAHKGANPVSTQRDFGRRLPLNQFAELNLFNEIEVNIGEQALAFGGVE